VQEVFIILHMSFRAGCDPPSLLFDWFTAGPFVRTKKKDCWGVKQKTHFNVVPNLRKNRSGNTASMLAVLLSPDDKKA